MGYIGQKFCLCLLRLLKFLILFLRFLKDILKPPLFLFKGNGYIFQPLICLLNLQPVPLLSPLSFKLLLMKVNSLIY